MMTSRSNRSAVAVNCRTFFFTVVLVVSSQVVQACLWDWDTLQMERRAFPGVLEMITGKFVRHSREYYLWRIGDRLKRMTNSADDPVLADDLAVAYLKLGKHAEAIKLLEKVLQEHPDRYETLANLGTVQMLAGNLQLGKDYIDRATVINPDAHFGREKYQSLLAEYFLTVRTGPPSLATGFMMVGKSKPQAFGFAQFILDRHSRDLANRDAEKGPRAENVVINGEKWSSSSSQYSDAAVNQELAAAQKGVLGMMHFANYDSPLLLEALGDLLVSRPTHEDDALQLAARAYYRVSQLTTDDTVKKAFEQAADTCLEGQYDYIKFRGDFDKPRVFRPPLEKLSADLNQELADAEQYVSRIADDENRWIKEGVNVDRAFAAKYYDTLDDTIKSAEQQLAKEPRDVRGNPYQQNATIFVLTCVGVVSVVVAIAVVLSMRSSRLERGPPR